MQKILTLVKKFLDNPKFSFLVAVFQGCALVLSYLVYHSFDEFWGMTHSIGGEGPMEVSTLGWIINLGWYFIWGVLPHLILGVLQVNYLVKFIKKTDKPAGDIVLRVIAWSLLLGCSVVVLGFGLSAGVLYVHDVYFRY